MDTLSALAHQTDMEPTMKIAVVGASGLMGSKIVQVLERDGLEVVRASPSSGVDAYAGAGLEAALAGVDALIDVTNEGHLEKATLSTSSNEPGQTSSLQQKPPAFVTMWYSPLLAQICWSRMTTSVPNSFRRTR